MIDMKILFVTYDFYKDVPEGHRVIARNLVRALLQFSRKERSITIHIVSPTKVKHTNIIPGRGAVPDIKDANNVLKTLPQIQKLKPDIVHLLAVPKELYGVVFKIMNRKNTSLVSQIYNSPYAFLALKPYRFRVALASRGMLGNIISTSKTTMLFLRKTLNFMGSEKININYVPPPVYISENADKENNVQEFLFESNHVVAYIGSLALARGIIDALKSFHEISKEEPEARFLILAPKIWYHDTFEHLKTVTSLAEKLGIIAKLRIKFTTRPEMHKLAKLIDIIVLPFKREFVHTSPPIVVLELMALGKAIVTYADPFTLDTLYQCDAIAKAPYGKTRELASTTVQLLQSPSELKTLSCKAKRYIIEHYFPHKVAQHLVKTYTSILNGS